MAGIEGRAARQHLPTARLAANANTALVAKAGLVELTDDDRAALYGALLELAARLRGDDAEQALLLWRRRGQRAFADDAEKPGR